MGFLDATDPEIARLLDKELERQRQGLELIASENFTSPAVLEAMGSVLTNKYAEGYPGHRYYGGCEIVDEVEDLARERVKALFGAEHANVQPHSGAQANMGAYHALLKPGDTVLGLRLAEGGHLTHGSPVNFSGQLYRFISYGLRADTETIDYDALREMALTERPKLIVAGASAYPRTLDFQAIRKIADEVGAFFMVDMAHIAGLVAAGLHPTPVGVADVVTSTTHKTLRGPRGGFILARQDLAKAIDKAIFPGIQGGPLMHIIAAKAVAFKEAMTPAFKAYQGEVVKNARALADGLTSHGHRLVAGGTDTHLMLLSLVGREISGKDAENLLGRAAITVNKNAVPGDPLPPTKTSGIRLGSPAVTTRGLKEQDMTHLAGLIDRLLTHPQDEGVVAPVREEVMRIAGEHPLYPDLRGGSVASGLN